MNCEICDKPTFINWGDAQTVLCKEHFGSQTSKNNQVVSKGRKSSELPSVTEGIKGDYYNEDSIGNPILGERNSQSDFQVFLCHSSGDKEKVRLLYTDLNRDNFNPWLDEEDLLPGMDWEAEITNAVYSSSVVLVCISNSSVAKTGFVQREIKFALDKADEMPEGKIFIIPVKFEECDAPNRLKKWHWVSLFESNGYEKLKKSLELCREKIDV